MAGLIVEKVLSGTIACDVESFDAVPVLAHTPWLLSRRSGDAKDHCRIPAGPAIPSATSIHSELGEFPGGSESIR
jgi:hypothetical protein